MSIKQLRLLSVNLLSYQSVYLTRRQFFTAELETILSALHYIKITVKNNKYVVFGALNLRCRLCCPSGIIPQFRLF